ncbi:hypothetical protein H0H92_003013, partial [Tricholoma furcatifolium]
MVSWSEAEEMDLNPDDEAFKLVPIVVNVDGDTVLTAGAASAETAGLSKKTKARQKYNEYFE